MASDGLSAITDDERKKYGTLTLKPQCSNDSVQALNSSPHIASLVKNITYDGGNAREYSADVSFQHNALFPCTNLHSLVIQNGFGRDFATDGFINALRGMADLTTLKLKL